MTDFDDTLFVAKNQRPAIIPGAAWNPALFPSNIAPNYLDLRVATDLCRAGPLYACFRIASAFNNQAGNFLRFAAFVDSDPSFINTVVDFSTHLIQSNDFASVGLGAGAVGAIVQLPLPPHSDFLRLLGEGRRFMCLGLNALVPVTDWVAGGIDAWFSPKPCGTRPIHHAAGW